MRLRGGSLCTRQAGPAAAQQSALGEIDLMALDVGGTVTARLDSEAPAEEESEEDETESAGPLQIAVDLNETPS